MNDVIHNLREHLITRGIVRKPNVAGPGARPWLPPAYKFPEDGAVGPGDAADENKDVPRDDGLVLSLMWAPGIPPAAGEEQRRIDGVDLVFRSRAVPPVLQLEQLCRAELLGADPGGRVDWQMSALYVIQSRQWRPFQPISTEDGIFTFSVGYTVESWA